MRPSRCASSCRLPNVPETWMATFASGRSSEKLATLDTTTSSSSPSRKAANRSSRSRTGVCPVITGAPSHSPSVWSWSRYWPMTSTRSSRWRSAVALLRLGHGVVHALVLGEVDPDLDAVGGGDPALRLQLAPGDVVALRADEAEHVGLAAVLAHQRRGQAEPPARLDLRGHAEDRRRQQVHL